MSVANSGVPSAVGDGGGVCVDTSLTSSRRHKSDNECKDGASDVRCETNDNTDELFSSANEEVDGGDGGVKTSVSTYKYKCESECKDGASASDEQCKTNEITISDNDLSKDPPPKEDCPATSTGNSDIPREVGGRSGIGTSCSTANQESENEKSKDGAPDGCETHDISMTISDDDLFKDPPPKEDCPI